MGWMALFDIPKHNLGLGIRNPLPGQQVGFWDLGMRPGVGDALWELSLPGGIFLG